IGGPAAVRDSRAAGDDERSGHMAERVRDVLRDALGKTILVGVTAEVCKRKDGNRELVAWFVCGDRSLRLALDGGRLRLAGAARRVVVPVAAGKRQKPGADLFCKVRGCGLRRDAEIASQHADALRVLRQSRAA